MSRLELCRLYLPVAAVASLGLGATAALAEQPVQKPASLVSTQAYTCEGKVSALEVAYFTAPDSTSFAALLLENMQHAMVQDVSGSGVRYVEIDGGDGYSIHTKGDDLLLAQRGNDPASEELELATCTAVKS